MKRLGCDRLLPGPSQLAVLPAPLQVLFPLLFVGQQLRSAFIQTCLRGDQLLAELGQRPFLVFVRERKLRAPCLRAAIRNQTRLLHIGEERLHRVEVLRQERIELVIVAFRASKSAA